MIRTLFTGVIPAICGALPAASQRLVPDVLIEGRFNGAEGLAISAKGRLYLAANPLRQGTNLIAIRVRGDSCAAGGFFASLYRRGS